MFSLLVHFLQASFKSAFMLPMNERLLSRVKQGSHGLPFMFAGRFKNTALSYLHSESFNTGQSHHSLIAERRKCSTKTLSVKGPKTYSDEYAFLDQLIWSRAARNRRRFRPNCSLRSLFVFVLHTIDISSGWKKNTTKVDSKTIKN